MTTELSLKLMTGPNHSSCKKKYEFKDVFCVCEPSRQIESRIVTRGWNFDAFVRTFDDKTGSIGVYQPDLPNNFKNIELEYRKYDPLVKDALRNTKFIGESLLNATVSIIVKLQDPLKGTIKEISISGCIVTSRHIFTVGRIFNTTKKVLSVMITTRDGQEHDAHIYELNPALFSEIRLDRILVSLIGSNWLPAGSKGRLDFAVLESETDLPPSSLYIPERPNWSKGSVLCALCRNGTIPTDTDEIFSYTTHCYLRSLSPEQRAECTSILVKECLNSRSKSPLAFFGAAATDPWNEFGYYGLSSQSAIKELSGAPIIDLDCPNELVGLVLGSSNDQDGTIFLDMQTPFVKDVYAHLKNICKRI